MGRKQGAQLELVTPDEPAPQLADDGTIAMPPRRQRARTAPRRTWRDTLRVWAVASACVALLVAAIAGAYKLDQFLASDPRFVLTSAGLRIEGGEYSARERLWQVFLPDIGRSVYLVPLVERRRALLRVSWVREASIARLWPNRLQVRVTERKPAAFAMLPDGPQSFRTMLIDSDGVFLDPPARAKFDLPALFGVRAEQTLATRRDRVRLMQQLMDETRSFSKQISEIDVSDPENVKVIQTVDGRAVRLLLGREHFLPKLKNFLNHYADIRKRLPQASVFDLRLDDRITALETPGDGK